MLGGLSTLPENPTAGGSKGEEGDRSSAGNRWPTEETLALLKVRSEMDLAFKDSGVKAPLWEQVSKKLAELGYHRSAKKCKEKFENIYKYHKRAKEQHSTKSYRFFEQLEAFESHQPIPLPVSLNPPIVSRTPVENIMPTTAGISNSIVLSSSEEEMEGGSKKKRKLAKYFERLMKKLLEKQESLQRQFIEVLEKYERDRVAREEAWKVQELARLERERELLVQERSIAAAKDAAVLAFLQKFSDQSGAAKRHENLSQVIIEAVDCNNSSANTNSGVIHASSSRWPKEEVEALISLKSSLDLQYHESGPKGPLWEEISSGMKRLGYNRSGKRCKEKWENINKYFKRVKESKKRRPEDAKTCPYFEQLNALYGQRSNKSRKGGEPLMHSVDREGTDKQEHREGTKRDEESERSDPEIEREHDNLDGSQSVAA
ncbi:trihelix transcription factor GT-2-like [Punica granatum]|uniref:Myb-like domain-containing protein n=2 Tax=Punica granatum TaxID=22663 RepID=A0A218WUY5_PUNGR|nr:trihelix transcription factor GT-2-like [Punica granatum]OWM76396.1 hypothetical protein CDL15_Pgr028266 [Punica granatum]PKI58607.1 hypothetical protein CRG98_020996 [Punica granatum]